MHIGRCVVTTLLLAALAFSGPATAQIALRENARIVLIGNGLGSRLLHHDEFETGLHARHPDLKLFIRNMCDEGNTPAFRPHSARANQLGFPGAEKFHAPYSGGDPSDGVGHYETDEQWLTRLKPDVLIAFFGFNESFQGGAGLEGFRAEIDAFLKHTLAQKYNGVAVPKLALVSPTAFEDRSAEMGVPDGRAQNGNLAAVTAVMADAAAAHGVPFVNAFNASLLWYAASPEPLTADGALLNAAGYARLSALLIDALFGPVPAPAEAHRSRIREAVREKNWFWINDFKMPNGVHAFGRRYEPFGPANYPFEIKKIREMTAIRDEAIWEAAHGRTFDTAARDAKTSPLPAVDTNYKPGGKNGPLTYLKGNEALKAIKVPDGYRLQQWATEQEFPDLANPVQLSFDNRGRLWVAVMPSYPHYRPGDPRPNDKLLILEDTDGDGKADRQTVFADRLHLPMGFELAPEGVYVSQGIHLVLLRDRDGDDRADETEIVFSGFDDHDTHHAISAFCADPSGAILMAEGTFLRTSVETPYGPVRGTNGGFYRFAPQRRHLERHAQLSIPNPWGIAFDDWGQTFFLHTSGPTMEWMLPGSVRPRYGAATPGSRDLIEPAHRVRPTSGLEFLSSRHFPDEVQGDLLLNNAIGFLGTKQHRVMEEGTGYRTAWRQNLTESTDGNFRPVDLEIAPDGSLYIVDWHNPLIGHMQHNARDPHRDHAHGRIYRVTYPARPLVEPAKIHGAPVARLLENLKLPEYRSRYRTRRELRGRPAAEVLPAVAAWAASLDRADPNLEHHLVEALWVTWGLDRPDEALLRRLLASADHRVRAAAVHVLRYSGHRIAGAVELLTNAARDPHGRVKLEAIVAASWLPKEEGLAVLAEAAPLDDWIRDAHRTALAHLKGQSIKPKEVVKVPARLKGEARKQFARGAEIYGREGHCGTCHQPDGRGLTASGFPPLAGTDWVTQDEERLIKLTLHGLLGPMEVGGRAYPGLVPMTPFAGLLDDAAVADVLTYVRNSFGNAAAPISAKQVAKVRAATRGRAVFYSPEELLTGVAAASPGRPFVKVWAMEDFKGAFEAPLRGRSFEAGRRMFEAASCSKCHSLEGKGRAVGADLSKAGREYPGAELLRQIVEPSARIKEEHRVFHVDLKDESRTSGIIVRRDGDTIHVAENLQKPEETIAIRAADVAKTTPSEISAMPTGLLVTLTREEILDLVAYVAANGDRNDAAFSR